MEQPAPGIPLERLVAHREWVRRVARALVRDQALAEDLEQEVWAEALRTPPASGRSLGGWLAAAMRHNLIDHRRAEVRRRVREESVARPEAEKSAGDLVAEAELHKKVVAAVLDLEEPGRGTILLRYFEDLPLKEVARRQGVPLETVRTRVRTGIEALRRRFDDEGRGDRRAWSAMLAPLMGVPADAAGAGTEGSALATTTGVLLMGAKGKAVVAVACTCLLAIAAWQVIPSAPSQEPTSSTGQRRSGVEVGGGARPASAPSDTSSPAGPEGGTAPRAPERRAPSGVRVFGVVTGSDGTVVPGARVLCEVPRAEPAEVAVADGNGEFRVERPEGAIALIASAPGHGDSAIYDVGAKPEGVVRVEMRLRQIPGAIQGRVLGALGQPVEGARVSIGGNPYLRGIRMIPQAGEATARASEPLVITTDASGGFRAERLPVGMVEVLVRAQAMTTAQDSVRIESGQVKEVEYRLKSGSRLSGTVRDDAGMPVPRATVEVLTVGGNLVVRSGPDGTYEFPSVPATGCLVVAKGEDGSRAQADLTFSEGEEKRWDPLLGRGTEIRGRLLDERGAPLKGWALLAIAGELETGHYERARSGQDGAFSLANCVDLPYLLLVSQTEQAVPVLTRKGVLAGAGELVLVVSDDALPSAFITGRVVDELGRPREKVHAMAIEPERGLGAMMVENDAKTGAFRLGPLPAGRVNLGVWSMRSNGNIFRGQFVLAKGGEVDIGTLVEQPPGSLRVSFVVEEKVEGVMAQYFVEPIRDDPGPRELRIGDAKGEAVLTLPAGRWSVSVNGGFLGDEARVEVVAGRETRVALNLREATARWFRIHGPGEKTSARTVQLIACDERGSRVSTGNYGRGDRDAVLAAAYLRPGSYEIQVRVDDGSEVRRQVTILDDEGSSMDRPIDIELR